MDNKKKIIFGLIAGIIFIIAFILNLLFPPKPFIKSAHADDSALIEQYGYFVPGNQLNDSDVVVDHLPALKGWVPDDYTYGDMLLDLASSIIGSSTAINSENVDLGIQTIEAILDAGGFWLDTTSGLIKAPAGVYAGLSDFQHDHGYDYPSASQVGGWFELPASVFLPSKPSWGTCYLTPSTGSMLYVTCIGDVCYVASFTQSSFNHQWSGSQQVTNHPLNTTYYGSESVGYYTGLTLALNNTVYLTGTSTQTYASRDEALSFLFGFDQDNLPGSDPVFNGNVYLDDTLAPVNILDIPGNDGRARSIQRNTDINNNIVNNYGGSNNIVLSPKLEDIPNNNEYELPDYPEIPHDLPAVTFEYPEIVANEEISEGLDGLSPLWVTLLTMGGSFIVLKVIL